MRKQRTRADLRTKLLPCQTMSAEVLTLYKDHEVRIPNINHRARHITDTINDDRPLHHARHAHITLNQIHRIRILNNAAVPRPPMSPDHNVIHALARSQPRRHTPSPIARELRLTAVGIEQSQKKLAVRPPVQKL